MLLNFLDNAVSAAPERSTIEMRSTLRPDGTFVVCIGNRGPAIAPEMLPNLFRKYQQGVGGFGGWGLGLTFCRLAIEHHGGTIRAISPFVDGEGVAFEFTLPAPASRPPSQRARARRLDRRRGTVYLEAMSLFSLVERFAPEEFYVVRRRDIGLTAFLCIDDTRLGPAAGGIRWRAYATPEEGAHDVLRLARAMTHKNAFAEIDFGGGKTVVLRDPAMRPAQAFPVLGALIDSLGGRYLTACDYGTTARELALVKSRTGFALAEDASGALDLGTATGVLAAIRAAWRRASGGQSLDGVRVVVQGVGDVGFVLVRLLQEAGVAVRFSEVDEQRAARCRDELGAARVPAGEVYGGAMDVFAPCAVGEVITEEVARRLDARAVAGAANNQLASEAAGRVLQQRGIWYAPDFAANAGAVIVGFETAMGRAATALAVVRRIEERLDRVFEYAATHGVTPADAAIHFARQRLEATGPPPR